MKLKNCIILLVLLSFTLAKAQVGIGTSSPDSSLDIRSSSQAAPSSTDGILIPKINVFPANPTAAQQSMLVYLTTAVGAKQPGFYYWNFPTLTWIGLGTSSTAWNLSGNASTTPGSNFLGTTDDKDIVFKRNNIQAGYIGDPVFSGTLYNNSNTVFGANSLISPTINYASQFGVRNTVVGANAMPTSAKGSLNIAIGVGAMFSNTDGSTNTVVGAGALYSNATGNGNVAIGRNTLTSATVGNNTGVGFASLRKDTSGTNNTAFGYQSGYSGTTGSNNVYIGNNAGYTNNGDGNVMIGNEAGFAELTGSNKLYINNAQADAVNALVYGEFDNKKLRVNGQLQISDQTTTGYNFPTTRGTNGQVLQTDGSGNLSWVNPANAAPSIIRVGLNYPSGDQTLTNGDWQKILFNTVMFDTNSEFDVANNRFKPTRPGYYEINAGYHIRPLTGNDYYTIGVRVNGSVYYAENGSSHTGGATATIIPRFINTIVYLNGTTDYVEIWAQCTVSGAIIESFTGKTFFEAHQIK